MALGEAYRLQINTSVHLKELDEEECRALIFAMHDVSVLYGMQILTYRVRLANLMVLAESRLKDFLVEDFVAAEEKQPGSGRALLTASYRKCFGDATVDLLNLEITDTAKSESVSEEVALHRVVRRLGNPESFMNRISGVFSAWVERNRPDLYYRLDGEVFVDSPEVSKLVGDHALRNAAAEMDRAAIDHDQGNDPRVFWSGYSDALRGDQLAMDGLKILIASPHATSMEALEYKEWLSKNRSEILLELEEEVGLPEEIHVLPNNPPRLKRKRRSFSSGSSSQASKPVRVTSPVSLGWKSVVAGFLVLLCICAAVIYFIQHRKPPTNTPPKPLTAEAEIPTNESEQNDLDKLETAMRALSGPDSMKLAEKFTMSIDIETRLKLCRYPEKIRKRLSDYPEQAVSVPPKAVIPGRIMQLPNIIFRGFRAEFADGSTRAVCVVSTDDGLKVDWDAYARYGTATWRGLLTGVAKMADMRVQAVKSNYYNFNYRDEEKWLSLTLTSLDHDGNLHAYARRGTKTAKLLMNGLTEQGGGGWQPIILRISSDGDSYKRKQFTIERLLAFGSVVGDVDAEDAWDDSAQDQP
ncbi:MAG: hypothetical protein AB8F34_03965 [Akkermansiaceae bacterium]